MRKGLLLLLTFSLFSVVMVGQINIKPHLGFNISQLSTEPQDFTQEGRVGALLGVGVMIGSKFYVEPAVQWTSMGTEMIHKDDEDFNFDSQISLFRIPVMFGYNFMDQDAFFNLRLYTGPSASFVLSVDESLITKDQYSSMIWGWDIGVGMDVWILYLELGYEMGLSPVFDSELLDTDAKNNAFLFTIGANLF